MADTPAAAPASAAPSSPATSAPASATPTPGLESHAGSSPSDPSSGEPPRERWNDILQNTRSKTRAEVEAEYRQRYAPYEAFETDPWRAVQEWLQQAGQHSLYAPQVQQWDERLAPLEQFRDYQAQLGAFQQANAQAQQQASQTLGQLRQQPYFKDHEPAIRQALAEHEEWGDNVHAAYNHVLVTQILPSLSQAEQQSVIDTLTTKATGTTVAPGGHAPGRPHFKSFGEAAEYAASHPEWAQAMANR